MKRVITFMFLMLIIISPAFSGGYQVRLQGQRQTGMGLIGTSLFGDASNLFYNPAGLSKIDGNFSFSAGMSSIFNQVAFRLENTYPTIYNDNPVGTPFYVYGSGMITSKLSFGVGAYTPYGSSAVWGDDWVGAELVQDLALKAIFIQPTLAYRFNDYLSFGAGFVMAIGDVELNRALPYNSIEVKGKANLSGKTDNAYGFNLGLLVTPDDRWSVGLNYRSKVIMGVEDGDALFTLPSSIPAPIFAREHTFSAELPMPANLDFGFSYRASEKLLLAAEINYVFWDVYDTLSFKFTGRYPEMSETLNSDNPRLYSNSLITRVGAEYVVNNFFTIRGGMYYDPTPTNKDYFTPETPSLNTLGLTLGVSIYPVENFVVELSYLHLETSEDTRSYKPSNFTGAYKSRTAVPGVGLRYNF
jgi:long-chain fatty acid transport protein